MLHKLHINILNSSVIKLGFMDCYIVKTSRDNDGYSRSYYMITKLARKLISPKASK